MLLKFDLAEAYFGISFFNDKVQLIQKLEKPVQYHEMYPDLGAWKRTVIRL